MEEKERNIIGPEELLDHNTDLTKPLPAHGGALEQNLLKLEECLVASKCPGS